MKQKTKLRPVFVLLMLAMVSCRQKGSQITETYTNLEAVSVALDLYKVDHDVYPPSLDTLLPKPNAMWQGDRGYVRSTNVLVDSWGTKLRFEVGTNSCELRSAGPDRHFGTFDDIVINK